MLSRFSIKQRLAALAVLPVLVIVGLSMLAFQESLQAKEPLRTADEERMFARQHMAEAAKAQVAQFTV